MFKSPACLDRALPAWYKSLTSRKALNMDDWRAAAQELDVLAKNETWKADPASDDYNVTLISARLKALDDARTNCDVTQMLYLVRTALSRDLGGMGNIRLYKHSHIGTKDMIERYIDSALETIKALVCLCGQALPVGIDVKDVLEQVVSARQAFGRSALLLSGGATFGMNHIGVLKALYENQLLPRIISGASAGSIVCAMLCTRTDEEIPAVLKEFAYGDLAVFEEDGREDGLLERIGRFLTQGAWIDIKHLIRVMKILLGDMTFQESYNRTRRILNICVSSASVYELPRLLNYVTSPNVMIWSAVAASCSVPLLFSPAQLMVKNPITGAHTPWNPTPQRWIDGSVDNDLPMTRLAEMFNVNHFIVSQVNPHVVPFLARDDAEITHEALQESGPGWLYSLTSLAMGEALHRMHVLADLGIFPNLVTKARSVLSQKYSGDITILPEISYGDLPRMLKNPTAEFMEKACLCGERATWPKLSRIRNHCAVELQLDLAVQDLRAKVVFSTSQVDLRRMTTGSAMPTTEANVRHREQGERRRRVSGSNANPERSGSVDANDPYGAPKRVISAVRPPLRMAFSHRAPSSRCHQGPVLTIPISKCPSSLSATKAPLISQNHNMDNEPSSGAETLPSAPSSDADIDTHTDDSSPEPEQVTYNHPDHYSTSRLLFDSPVCIARVPDIPGNDPLEPAIARSPFPIFRDPLLGIVATTPPALLRPEIARRGSELMLSGTGLCLGTGNRNDVRSDGGSISRTAPSSPEKRYKRLFHLGE